MMRRSVDLPAPLAPTTPILAPWKNESQMPRRISRLGGTTLRRSFMTNAYSPAMARRTFSLARLGRRGPSPATSCSSHCHQAPVLGHHAAVLDDADAGAREPLGRR